MPYLLTNIVVPRPSRPADKSRE